MPSERIEVLEDIYAHWSQGDFRTPVSERFTIALEPEFPDAGEHIGTEGVGAYMKQFLEPWEQLTISAEEIIEGGDKVVARVLQVGVGKSSGIPVELRYFHLWTFEGPNPVRMETIMEESDAMERVGGD